MNFQPLLVKPKQSTIVLPLLALLKPAATARVGWGKNSVESLATLGSLEGINGN